jgi:hypothetical protein
MFFPPPLKFRTAGFPQYGFKVKIRGSLREHGQEESSSRPQLIHHLSSYLVRSCCSRSRVLPQAASSPSDASTSPQRPLAQPPVMLSGNVLAYYGLIRVSLFLSSLYVLCDESLARDQAQRASPLLSAYLFHHAIFSTPVDKWAFDCSGSFSLAFPLLSRGRHPRASTGRHRC